MNFKNFFKIAIRDVIKVGHALAGVVQKLPGIISKVEESKAAVEAATTLINPNFKAYEDLAYDALAHVADAIASGKAAVNQDGSLNVTHTVETVTAVKAMIADLTSKPGAPATN